MERLRKYWWVVAVRGLMFGLFGFIALTATYMDIRTLLYYLGLMFAGVGVIQGLVSAVLRKNISYWIWLIFISVIDLFVAYFLIFKNSDAGYYYLKIMAFWALLMGLSMVVVAIRQKSMRVFVVINGALSLGFSAVIYYNLFQIRNLNFVIGFYSILLSLFILFIAYKMMRIRRVIEVIEHPTKPE